MALSGAQQVAAIGRAELRMFGTYQGHTFGPASSKTDWYIDLTLPDLRWAVCVRGMDGVLYPRVNTWRSAYGLMRRIQGKTSR